MTKLRPKPSELSEVRLRPANGRITKAKRVENGVESFTKSFSFGKADSKKSEKPTMPYISKCMPKGTSTPTTENGRLNLNVNSCRVAFSPILLDKENLSENKINREGTAKQSLTKRKSVGVRRLFCAIDDNTDNCAPKSIKSANSNVSKNETRIVKSHENTLIRNLRNDWSDSTLCETLHKTPQPQSNVFGAQPRLRKKRLLTTLIEGIDEECLSKTDNEYQNKENVPEDENYSSAAEFESDEEKENSRSKRAPTWKSLHTKPDDCKNMTTSSSSIRKSGRLTRLMGVILSEKAGDDLVNTDLIDPSIQLPRPRSLSQLQDFDLSDDAVGGQTNILAASKNPENKNKSANNGATSNKKRLPQGIGSNKCPVNENADIVATPKQTTCENSRECVTTCLQDVHLKPILHSKIKLPKVKLRKLRLDTNKNSPTTESPSVSISINKGSQTLQELQCNNQPNIELQGLEFIPEKEKSVPNNTADKPAARVHLARVRLQKLKLNSAQIQGVPPATSINKSSDLQKCEQYVGEVQNSPEKLNEPPGINIRIERTKPDDVQDQAYEGRHIPTSPIYDDVENNTTISKCTNNKFFTSRIFNTSPKHPEVENPKKTSGMRMKGDEKKEQEINDENIYEFFSQSQSEKNDPVADIIQKMINTGKVTVAKHNKRLGKLTLPKKKKGQTKTEIIKKVVPSKRGRARRIKQPLQTLQEVPKVVLNNDDESHFDGNTENYAHIDEPARERGSFSVLARSTMIKQAKKNGKTPQRKMITDRRKLLELAKKFVGESTPVKPNKPTQIINAPQFSPIYGNKSPWRVNDESLPKPFYFGRNSDNLPSYSSDHIPISQTEREPRPVSSFSSNESDRENIAPPSVREKSQFEPLSILRRAPGNRSPLKSIDIIEVVHLPPLTFDNTEKDKGNENNQIINKSTNNIDKTAQNESGTNNNVKNAAAVRKTVSNNITSNKNQHEKPDLFGFEDIIEEEDDATEASINISAIPTKVDLKEKLQRLKQLRPETPIVYGSKPEYIKPVLDGPRNRQKSLREMLCSTMIEQPKSNGQKTNNEQQDSFFNDGCDADLSNLFKDPEPETTFNESDARRTYSRLHKTRKRKLRNNFVMFLDSDVSEEEEVDEVERRSKKKHKNEHPKNKKELNKFVNEFNEMCKEISQYELIVE